MKNYLLMTATVTPPSSEPWLVLMDTDQRLAQYVEAFKFYLGEQHSAIDGIVFVDNSNHPLEEIRRIANVYQGNKEIEIISFSGLGYPVEYGRGYGELKLIEHAYENSRMMQGMRSDDRFWKVTGRLQVTTIDKIIRATKLYFDVCADFRYRRGHVDTRLIAFSIAGYKKYLYAKSSELPGKIIETWLFKKFTQLLGTDAGADIMTEFRVVPKFKGYAGSSGLDYMSYKQQLIYFVRSVYLKIKYGFKR